MKKNVVLIPWIEREEAVNESGIGRADRTKGYKYGVDSWKQWCEKHDVEFFLMDELLVPESEMVITWQRWYVLEILEKNGIDQIWDKVNNLKDHLVKTGQLEKNRLEQRKIWLKNKKKNLILSAIESDEELLDKLGEKIKE